MKQNLNVTDGTRKQTTGTSPAKARKDKWKALIVRLYLEGNSMRTVKEKAQIETGGHSFGLDTVQKYIREAVDEWKASKIDMVENHKAIELEKVNRLEATYWDGWYRSLNAVKTTKTKKGPAESGKSEETPVKDGKKVGKSAKTKFETLEVTDENRESWGDVRFLQGVDRCVELRLKILGIDTPPKIEVNTTLNTGDTSTTYIRKVVFKTRETTAAPQTFITNNN